MTLPDAASASDTTQQPWWSAWWDSASKEVQDEVQQLRDSMTAVKKALSLQGLMTMSIDGLYHAVKSLFSLHDGNEEVHSVLDQYVHMNTLRTCAKLFVFSKLIDFAAFSLFAHVHKTGFKRGDIWQLYLSVGLQALSILLLTIMSRLTIFVTQQTPQNPENNKSSGLTEDLIRNASEVRTQCSQTMAALFKALGAPQDHQRFKPWVAMHLLRGVQFYFSLSPLLCPTDSQGGHECSTRWSHGTLTILVTANQSLAKSAHYWYILAGHPFVARCARFVMWALFSMSRDSCYTHCCPPRGSGVSSPRVHRDHGHVKPGSASRQETGRDQSAEKHGALVA